MGWFVAIYFIVGLITLYLFRKAKWWFLYALTWPLSFVMVVVCMVVLISTPSNEKFKIENM